MMTGSPIEERKNMTDIRGGDVMTAEVVVMNTKGVAC